jgi:hypothetical protein
MPYFHVAENSRVPLARGDAMRQRAVKYRRFSCLSVDGMKNTEAFQQNGITSTRCVSLKLGEMRLSRLLIVSIYKISES